MAKTKTKAVAEAPPVDWEKGNRLIVALMALTGGLAAAVVQRDDDEFYKMLEGYRNFTAMQEPHLFKED